MTQVLDTVSIKDTYQTKSGDKKTRTITIRAMVNDGSNFVNIHLGRGSVNLPEDKIDKVCKGLKSLSFKGVDESSTIAELKKKIAELEKSSK